MGKRKATTKCQPPRWPEEAKARRWVELHKVLGPPIESKIVKALGHGGYLSQAVAEEAAFHLTDWIVDLHDLNKLYSASRWNSAKAREVLMQFACHAPAHLAAAHLIIMGDPVTDVFEIGAVKGSGRGKRKPGAPYPVRKGRAPRSKQ